MWLYLVTDWVYLYECGKLMCEYWLANDKLLIFSSAVCVKQNRNQFEKWRAFPLIP